MEVREVQLEAVSEEGNWCRQMEAQSSQVQFKSSQVDPLRHLRPLPSATAGFRRAHSKGFRMVVSIVLFCIYWLDLSSFLCAHWQTLRQSQTKKAAAAAAAAAV